MTLAITPVHTGNQAKASFSDLLYPEFFVTDGHWSESLTPPFSNRKQTNKQQQIFVLLKHWKGQTFT